MNAKSEKFCLFLDYQLEYVCFGYCWIVDLSLMRIILDFMLKFSFYNGVCVGSLEKGCGTKLGYSEPYGLDVFILFLWRPGSTML